jgi:acyl-CoA thioesterase/uncharacterized protein (DUF427 family)
VGPTTTPELTRTDPAVEHRRSPLRARAWWGDELVADSTAAVQVEEPGQPPALYFPCADVRFDLFHDEAHHAVCPVKGRARLWSIDAPEPRVAAAPAASSASWTSPRLSTADGHDVLWSFTDPAAAVAWLSDHAAFDHDRVHVELIDGRPGDDERDVTSKRFPTWGDASQLIDLLDVRPHGERRYRSTVRGGWRRPVVEGSQVLGQAVVAASRHTGGRRPVSAHLVFHRAADARLPLVFELEEVSNGRTFTTLSVQVGQEGRRCATGTMLLDETAPDVIRHAAPPPEVSGPYESPPYDMSVTGRDLRIVDGAYTDDPDAPAGPPHLDAWVRYRDVPDDPCLHAALLAQFTGHLSIAAAMRPHPGVGQVQAHRSLSTAINAIAISFHADVAADRWMLYRHLSTHAGDGMSHSECRVHDEDGDLIASFTVDAMIRRFAPTDPVDDRTAL